ncbi:MAG TPA: OadG family protein [Prolixibacteraceae bacterium]|nr:OadG family protein [Prolixibacteraceae bacterium]
MIILSIDSQTLIITIVGWLVVFIALVLLIMVFNNIPRLMKVKVKVKTKPTDNGQVYPGQSGARYMSGDETAAIALALHLYFEEQHDEESNVITIKQIQRRYSPWSSKIYGVRNFPKN